MKINSFDFFKIKGRVFFLNEGNDILNQKLFLFPLKQSQG